MNALDAIGCPSCGHTNRAARHFCTKCGARLALVCGSCGAEREAADEFCGTCGAALTTPQPAATPAEAEPAPVGERRQLTVLFCDLVGSTELAGRMDPEEWREVVQRYQRGASEVVARFGGHVAQYLGDGLLAYFGWPQAHEDAAERAVRAGLGLVAANASPTAGVQLAVRVGIHTGPVVVSEIGGAGRSETLAMGETMNVAARVQAVAAPNTVVITAATQRLVAGLFTVEEGGAQPLKGVRDPVVTYRVVQASGMRGRLHASAARGLTPFVGREDERRLLHTRWELASEGDGQVVLVTGEAGIGKSRLMQQFKEDLGVTPHTWVECAASPFLENTPFHPVIDLLRQGMALGGESAADDREQRLEQGLVVAGLNPAEAMPLIAPLFGLPIPERFPVPLFVPEQQRRRLMATFVAWTVGIARLQPLVLVFEDLHHVDPSTLELLGLLVEQVATEPMLLLFTARPEFRAPWPMRSHHAQVTLTRLSRRQVRELVACVAARTALAEDMVETVVTRTDGVPLFVEEFVRLLLEGEGPSLLRDIPTTLQDSLMARLDRLGPAKEVAQVASVLGNEFSFALLEAVAERSRPALDAALERLVDAELVYARGLTTEVTYLFKHTLMQDAAYASLLKSRRRELHRVTARQLVEKFPDVVEGRPELVARHHAEAGDVEPAVAAWKRAGERAAARSALVEAIGHFEKALELLRTLPETPARIGQELELQVPLGFALRQTKGWSSPEATASLTRARELGERLGDTRQLMVVFEGLWAAAFTGGEPRAAQDIADQMLRVAERDGRPAMMLWPHVVLGLSRWVQGDPKACLHHAERAMALYDEKEQSGAPIDAGVFALTTGAYATAYLGDVDQARRYVADALTHADRIARAHELALARLSACVLYYILREPHLVLEHTERLLQIAATHQLPSFTMLGGIYRAWAVSQQEPHDVENIARIRRSLGEYLALGQRTAAGQNMGVLAAAYLQAGAMPEALATIGDGLAAAPEEELYLPELLRLRGDGLLAHGAEPSEVEASYQDAIAMAHRQGSKLMELRAATSLGRLLHSHGRRAEARALVAPLYAAFTEGFDARDLVEAKALLAELE